jgi:hypothetical protein
VDTSAAAAVTCGTTTPTQPITFTVASGYTCGTAGLGSNATPCAPRPVKTTLFLTDPVLGAVTLTFSGSAWGGTLTVSRANVRLTGCVTPATRDILVQYSLAPVSPVVGGKNTQWQLSVTLEYCSAAGTKVLIATGQAGASSEFVQGTTTSGGCPETGAVSVTLNFAGQAANTWQSIWGTSTQGFSFSE